MTSHPVLTMLDTLQIQTFIFSSNRLKDIVAGSLLAEEAVSKGILETFAKKCDGEIIFSAGGNALLRFPDLDQAKSFLTDFSRHTLETLPGLEILGCHQEYQFGNAIEGIFGILKKMADAKLRRTPSLPLLGLGVTEICSQTGLPADHTHDQNDDRDPCVHRSISIRRNLDLKNRIKKRWQKFLPQTKSDFELEFPLELDFIGRSHGDTSLLGVIHIDGNGIGKRIENWLKSSGQEKKTDDVLFREYREFSAGLNKVAEGAMEKTIAMIAASAKHMAGKSGPGIGNGHRLEFPLHRKENSKEYYLPIRPIVCGGDDLTIVCDGRIALSVAAIVLDAFESTPVPHLGKVTASAGVAITWAHAPFIKSYKLAEELCKSAKSLIRASQIQDSAFDASAVDWNHEVFTSLRGSLEDRNSCYTCPDNGLLLTARPYFLGTRQNPEKYTWRWLEQDVIGSFNNEPWRDSRNKIKHVLATLRKGRDAMEYTMEGWKALNPGLSFPAGIPDSGFHKDRLQTCLIDAVELLDIHLPFEEV